MMRLALCLAAAAMPWCPTAAADETLVPDDFVLRTNQSYNFTTETAVCLSEESARAFLRSGIERNFAEAPGGCRKLKLEGFIPVRKLLGHSAPAWFLVPEDTGSLLCTDRITGHQFRCEKRLGAYGIIEGKVPRPTDGTWVKVFVQMDDLLTVADPEQPAQPGPRGRKAAP